MFFCVRYDSLARFIAPSATRTAKRMLMVDASMKVAEVTKLSEVICELHLRDEKSADRDTRHFRCLR